MIINNNLIITASSGETHEIVKNLQIGEIIKSIQSVSNEISEKYDSLLEYIVPYVNLFDTIYAVGFFIDRESEYFRANLIILRRNLPIERQKQKS